jgi:hypothetical protein
MIFSYVVVAVFNSLFLLGLSLAWHCCLCPAVYCSRIYSTPRLQKGQPMTDAEQDAADDAQQIQWARADDAARKAATDAHFPDFDIYAEEMCDPRYSLRKWHDDVVRIPAANKG